MKQFFTPETGNKQKRKTQSKQPSLESRLNIFNNAVWRGKGAGGAQLCPVLDRRFLILFHNTVHIPQAAAGEAAPPLTGGSLCC